ncbi:MAG: hypothetical protein WDA08_04655 [Weeksellaceae bacterium]
MASLGFKNLVVIFGFLFFNFISCNLENTETMVNVQILSRDNQEPLSGVDVTIITKVNFLSLKKSEEILETKTDSLGIISFKGDRNINYNLWIKNKRSKSLLIEELILKNFDDNDTIFLDINMSN